MLPLPVLTPATTSSSWRGHDKHRSRSLPSSSSPSSSSSSSSTRVLAILRFLRARSRATNLGVLILAALAAFSVLHNLAHVLESHTTTVGTTVGGTAVPASILATFDSDTKAVFSHLTHLVVVPGHAVWTGIAPEQVRDEAYWTLEDYQRGHDEAKARIAAFVDHIRLGVQLAVEDESALLVFSGGQTRRFSTTTEAESYFRLALSLDLFSTSTRPPFVRATTETFAMDSFQNLLFSLARFHEMTGRYPSRITVVGYEMKRRRFEQLHRAALRIPRQAFHYVGLEPPTDDRELARAQEGELQNGYLPYSNDVYGCHDFLLAKRRARNPALRFHPYHASAPELRGLLEWCPNDPREIYRDPLPWDILE